MLGQSVALRHESSFQDNATLLVPLLLVCRKFVHPPELSITVFAADVSDHVTTRQHHSILNLAIIQIDDFVEEERASRGTRETRAHELWPVGEIGVAGGAGKQATATDVLEKYHSHLESSDGTTCLKSSIREQAAFVYLANRYESMYVATTKKESTKSHNCQRCHTALASSLVCIRVPCMTAKCVPTNDIYI